MTWVRNNKAPGAVNAVNEFLKYEGSEFDDYEYDSWKRGSS
jgi:hypothetical protein